MYSLLLIKHKYLEFFILNVAVKGQWRKPRPPTKKNIRSYHQRTIPRSRLGKSGKINDPTEGNKFR